MCLKAVKDALFTVSTLDGDKVREREREIERE
jgi:hypothetical protein